MEPIVQIALDFTDTEQAIQMGHIALQAGADWLEAGYPLITTQGISAIGALSSAFSNTYLLADFMVIAGAERFIQAAKVQGAKNVTVSALAPDITVHNCIHEGKKNGIKVTVDLFHTKNLPQRAMFYEEMGADYVMVHLGLDEKKDKPDKTSLKDLHDVVNAVKIPVSYASYTVHEAVEAVRLGARVIVQGAPPLSFTHPQNTLRDFIQAVKRA